MKNLKFIWGCLWALSLFSFSTNAEDTTEDLPFLKSDYLYEYLHEVKTSMGGNVVSETKMETTYDDNNHIISMITTTNGAKTMEMIDYVYGDKIRSNTSNIYLNGQKMMTMKTNSTFADDIYRNMTVNESETDQMGKVSKQRNEWTYDDQGRIIGMKQFLNGELQLEQKDYEWTPNSCSYVEILYFPMKSTKNVSKQFKDDHYIQNILEVHETDMNGVKMESRSEWTYDDAGNMTSFKNYSNGQLSMEWKDFVWGDKKGSHTEIMYMNGAPTTTSEVKQYYK